MNTYEETVSTVSYVCSCKGCSGCEPQRSDAEGCTRLVPNGKRGYCRECRREYDRARWKPEPAQKLSPIAFWPRPKAA